MRSDPEKTAAGALGLAILLALAALPALSQNHPGEGTVFTGEAHVLAVEVPVQVLVGGEPVRGLTADDFRVFEGGELRPLTGFEVVDLSVSPGAEATLNGSEEGPADLSVPPAGRRHFLLFFDLSFTKPGYLSRGIEGARKLVREGVHPSDLVGVAFYDSRQGGPWHSSSPRTVRRSSRCSTPSRSSSGGRRSSPPRSWPTFGPPVTKPIPWA